MIETANANWEPNDFLFMNFLLLLFFIAGIYALDQMQYTGLAINTAKVFAFLAMANTYLYAKSRIKQKKPAANEG